MNVNFKPSINQGKSLRFSKSNDNKKTLFKNTFQELLILVSGAGDNTVNGTYKNITGELYLNRPIYREINNNNYVIRRGGGPDAWYIGNQNAWSPSYYNTTNENPWDGSWLTVPFRPSPAPTVTLI